MPPVLRSIHRYPVKGFSPEPLGSADLQAGECLPEDRRWALAHGDVPVDPADPRWMPKRAFLVLDRLPALAALWLRRTGEREVFELVREGKVVLRVDLASAEGCAALEQLITEYAGDTVRGQARLLQARGFAFCDTEQALVSIACRASLDELSDAIGRPVEVERFRANLLIDGGLPWQELDWIGEEIRIGEARLRVLEPILRCVATRANPRSGEPDLDVLGPLVRLTGDAIFGVYAEVVAGGRIAPGDPVIAPRGGRLPARHGLGL